MSILIYFTMIGFILLFGTIVLGVTFHQWYLEFRKKSEE